MLTVGILALALGVWVYLGDRDPARALLIPRVAWGAGLGGFGVVDRWLPSAVHPFAFALFTAAAMAQARAAWWYGGCVLWGAVGIGFELGQQPLLAEPLAEAVRQGLGHSLPARALANYFLAGTFDVGDIVATVLGALAAAMVLGWVRRRQCGTEPGHAA